MKVRQFLKEVEDATGQLGPDQDVFFFDGASCWGIELVIARHRSGDSLWITRTASSVEQESVELLFSIVTAYRASVMQGTFSSAHRIDDLVKRADELVKRVRGRSQV